MSISFDNPILDITYAIMWLAAFASVVILFIVGMVYLVIPAIVGG